MFESHRILVYRQGDLILEKVREGRELLQLCELVSDKLEVGSESGHIHVLNAKVYRYANQLYVVVEKPTVLKHPQHPPLSIEPGIYAIKFIRDWLLQERAID